MSFVSLPLLPRAGLASKSLATPLGIPQLPFGGSDSGPIRTHQLVVQSDFSLGEHVNRVRKRVHSPRVLSYRIIWCKHGTLGRHQADYRPFSYPLVSTPPGFIGSPRAFAPSLRLHMSPFGCRPSWWIWKIIATVQNGNGTAMIGTPGAKHAIITNLKMCDMDRQSCSGASSSSSPSPSPSTLSDVLPKASKSWRCYRDLSY